MYARHFLAVAVSVIALDAATAATITATGHRLTILNSSPEAQRVATPTISPTTGAVAFRFIDPQSGPRLRVVETNGDSRVIPIRTVNNNPPVINDKGQIVVKVTTFSSQFGRFVESLLLVEPDGSVRSLVSAVPGPDGQSLQPGFQFAGIEDSSYRLNNAGQVSFIGYTFDPASERPTIANGNVVLRDADGGIRILDSEVNGDSAARNIFGTPSLNENGELAWAVQNILPDAINFHGFQGADGVVSFYELEENVIRGGGVITPEINDVGDVVTSRKIPGGQAVAVVRDLDGSDPFQDRFSVSNIGFLFTDINNAGQVLGQTFNTDVDEIILDGIVQIKEGVTVVDGYRLENLSNFGSNIRQGIQFNELGQYVFEGSFAPLDPDPSLPSLEFVVRADPLGATADSPLMPFASTPEGQNDIALNIFNGLGVLAPIFVDPIVATGFVYTQGEGGANFASLIIPDALPGGQDLFTLEFLLGGTVFSTALGVGETFDFTALDPLGVAQFSILGIEPSEGIDPTDPFVVGLTFVAGNFRSVLSIDAITVDTDAVAPIPLPAPVALLASGMIALLGTRNLRRQV